MLPDMVNKEPTAKSIPGSFDWTPLSGKHKLQALKNLPAKMDNMILEESIAPSVAKLWNVSEKCCMYIFYNTPSSIELLGYKEYSLVFYQLCCSPYAELASLCA